MDRAEQIPRPPETNGEERWSSMDGTLIAIGAGGALPKSAVGRAAGSSPIWIGRPAQRGQRAGRTEQEDNTKGNGFFTSSFCSQKKTVGRAGSSSYTLSLFFF